MAVAVVGGPEGHSTIHTDNVIGVVEWGVNKMYVHCHGSSETKVLFRNGRATNCGPVWPQSTFAQCVPVIIIIRVKLSTETDHPHIRTEGVLASVRGMLTGTVTTTIMMM